MTPRAQAALELCWLTAVATLATLLFVVSLFASVVLAVTEGVAYGLAVLVAAGAVLWSAVATAAGMELRVR